MLRYFSLVFLIVCLYSCSPRYTHIIGDRGFVHKDIEQAPEELVKSLKELPADLFIPADIRTIRVAFHFFNNQDSTLNYNATEGKEIASILLSTANKRMHTNDKMKLPVGNDTPVFDSQIRYQLAKTQQGSALFYHYDKQPKYFIKRTKKSNIYDRDVISQYAYHPNSVLNVFVLPYDPEMISSGTEKVELTGVALGTSIKLPGLYQSARPIWDYAGTFNHEVGHVLGLRHAWTKYDQCFDTPVNSNCWKESNKPPCDQGASNNLMDYNAHQSAITPCQIAKMHATITNKAHRSSGLVVEDLCKKNDGVIEIESWTKWIQSAVVQRDIVIKKDGLLFIGEEVRFAAHVSIKIEKGGTLVVKSTTLGGSCSPWGGLYKHPKGHVFDLSSDFLKI